jgi:hypothetical protein
MADAHVSTTDRRDTLVRLVGGTPVTPRERLFLSGFARLEVHGERRSVELLGKQAGEVHD